jgi:hypothetical protein
MLDHVVFQVVNKDAKDRTASNFNVKDEGSSL